jgi:methylenetetrahydrofolate dehydrogenase (NADP+) / methenyltetrahydrofolate cyclohydrolase
MLPSGVCARGAPKAAASAKGAHRLFLRRVGFKMTARVLEGTVLARRLRETIRKEAGALSGSPPHLRVILLGNDPASESYVASKERAAREAGILAQTIRLASGSTPQALLEEIERANRDDSVDGVLVQMPLEPGHDSRRVFDALDPLKDVDGFHADNVGRLHQGRPRFVPCTPAGILALLDHYEIPIAGARAVVLGRSEIVGKPVAALLTSRDATVTLAHSKTRGLRELCREADILVAAIGRPGLVTAEFVREGAVVIDVGINRLDSLDSTPENLRGSARVREALAAGKRVLVGDVDFDALLPKVAAITPVPGGIGPLTVAMLLRNTLQAALERRRSAAAVLQPNER